MTKYRNRGIGRSGTDALTSGRIGIRGVRTFHVNFSSKKVGSSASGTIDYVAAEGHYAGRDDIEARTENIAEFRQAIAALDAAAKVRKGPTAERILCTIVMELPAAFDQEQRIQVGEKLVDRWEKVGHPALLAIHGNGIVQPHLHLAITARPVSKTASGEIVVDRDSDKRPFSSKKQIYAERRIVADIVNEVGGREIFHPGRLSATGIKRMPKRRLTAAAYQQGIDATKDPRIVVLQAAEHKRRKEEAKRREAVKFREKHIRHKARIKDDAQKYGLKALDQAEQQELKRFGAKNGYDAAMRKNLILAAKQKQLTPVRTADGQPATAKQIAYLMDLSLKTKRVKIMADWLKHIDQEDRAPTNGEVGKQIRQLTKLANNRGHDR